MPLSEESRTYISNVYTSISTLSQSAKYPISSGTELARVWPETDRYFESQREYAYFVTAGEENPLMNLFHRIRNSFSHGRFRMSGDYFFFEDVNKDGKTVMARICLTIVTLENWMRIIKGEGDMAKKVQNDMKKNRKKK